MTAEVIDRVTTSRGELVLRRVGGALEVISNGVFLMDTRDGRSERLLVRAALQAHARPQRLLVGGLGVGFSLEEAVREPALEGISVVEIEAALVRWHRDGTIPTARRALADPRVELVTVDLVEHLRGASASYDVICLDVDNGPDWTVTTGNARLYGDEGTASLVSALRRGGVLAVWSAHAVPAYEQRLREHFAAVSVHTVEVSRGEPDVVYVAHDPDRR